MELMELQEHLIQHTRSCQCLKTQVNLQGTLNKTAWPKCWNFAPPSAKLPKWKMADDIPKGSFNQGPIGWQAPIKANCVRFTIWKFKNKNKRTSWHLSMCIQYGVFFQGVQSIRERRKGWYRISSPVGNCCLSVSSCHCWPWSIPSVFLRCWAHFSVEMHVAYLFHLSSM